MLPIASGSATRGCAIVVTRRSFQSARRVASMTASGAIDQWNRTVHDASSPCACDWEAALRKTLVGCHALIGESVRPTDGPVDIVIDGRQIRDIRPSGATEPEGDAIDLAGRLVTAGLINGHHHSHEG